MNKFQTFVTVFVVLAVSGFFYLKKHTPAGGPDAPVINSGSQAAPGGKTGFIGDSGYLMELPSGYEAYAEMRGATELVLFYPGGIKPTADEAQYKSLGIIRLEVSAPPAVNGGRATLEDLKGGVLFTLKQNKETYTVKNVDLGKAAFQVDITLPKPITQLFVEGKKVFYVFTGADEKLMYSLAQSIQENVSAGLPKAP